MSGNELDLYSGGGGLQPYSGGTLAPAPDFGTGEAPTGLDNFSRQFTGGGQKVFGVALPPGVTIEKMTEAFTSLGSVFVSDFLKLGHDISRSQKAAQWLINAVANPPQPTAKRHSYNLYEHTNDPVFQAFANYAHDNKFPAKFVQDAAWWVSEAARRLNEQQQAPAVQGNVSTAEAMSGLSEAQYAQVVKINDAARAATMGYLSNLWGDSFEANLRMVNTYYQNLPRHEQDALDKMTTGYVSSLNTKEIILGLYRQAIGHNSIPSGGALASEIAECEKVMRTNRKAWLSDERLQARYRELLTLRSGG